MPKLCPKLSHVYHLLPIISHKWPPEWYSLCFKMVYNIQPNSDITFQSTLVSFMLVILKRTVYIVMIIMWHAEG
jgi:hypothetical protein